MAHEESITVPFQGRWVNLPGKRGGKKLTEDQAVKLLLTGQISPLGGKSFASSKAAVEAAKKRSQRFGKTARTSTNSPFRGGR
jgi:hypothetical protein